MQIFLICLLVVELCGIEALSRGAKSAVLCDNSYSAIKIINKNLEKTKLFDKAKVICKDYTICLEEVKKQKFDIIFLDPPYRSEHGKKAIVTIEELNLLSKDGIIILETDEDIKLDCSLNLYDIREYGRVKLLFISKER